MSFEHRTTILLAEDNAIISMDKEMFLCENGFDVVVASSGEEAVRAAEIEADIDLVLTDIDLGPGMDGLEAAERILEIREVPIVFLTNHAETEYVEKAKRITSYGYVLKSAGKFMLLESIDMALKLFAAHQELDILHRTKSVANTCFSG